MIRSPRLVAVAVLLAAIFAAPLSAGSWLGPDGEPLPFTTDAQILQFLRNAEIIERQEIPAGINKPLKVLLHRDGVEAHAVFRTVDDHRLRFQSRDKIHINFHDSYIYECAAYTVSRLLGLDHVPPCVLRRVDHKDGSLQLWVERAMTDKKRREKNLEPPHAVEWTRQYQTMRLFDVLVSNFDRNQGNILIGPNWKIWFIDHTRSFQADAVVDNLDRVVWCERGVWERLRDLTDEELRESLKPYVDRQRLRYFLDRRRMVVAHLAERVATRGEGSVLFEWGEEGAVEEMADGALAGADDDIPIETPR